MTGRRASLAERREARAQITDLADVLDAAARFLETRPRSVADVRRRLGSAGYRPELIEQAVMRLSELGYLDDEAFARAWVESRDRARPRGEAALRRELALKGIERPVIEAVLEERREAGSVTGAGGAGPVAGADEAAAERLLARHARTLAGVADPRARRRRAYALLARNGFDPEVAARVAGNAAPDNDAPRFP